MKGLTGVCSHIPRYILHTPVSVFMDCVYYYNSPLPTRRFKMSSGVSPGWIEGGEAGRAVGEGIGPSGNRFSESREPGVCARPWLVMREEAGA